MTKNKPELSNPQPEKDNILSAVHLLDLIRTRYDGNQARFGRSQGVGRDQVGKWVRKGYIVIDGQIYKPGRALDIAHSGKTMNKHDWRKLEPVPVVCNDLGVIPAHPLAEHIRLRYENKKALFGRSQGVPRAQVATWLRKKVVVIQCRLYLPGRALDLENSGEPQNTHD